MTASSLARQVTPRAGRARRKIRWAAVLIGLAVLAGYLLPGLSDPGARWPLWDARVYWWAGRQAARHAALYASGGPYNFTYPPFAASLFRLGSAAPEGWLAAAVTAMSIGALVVLCWQALGAAGVRREPETVFSVTALALLTWPVGYTLHLGEVNLIVAALAGADLLARRDGSRWQGIATGLAAGIKLTPLIFVAYLLLTRRIRAGVTAAVTFAATIIAGVVLLPAQSRAFWLEGAFANPSRVGNPANPSNQSLSGAIARLAGGLDGVRGWWLAAALLTGLAGIAVAVWAHRRGHRLGGVVCCAVTGLLVSPFSWSHHWVWAVPLLIGLVTTAWRRRSWSCGLLAAAVAVAFSGFVPLPWPGHPPRPALLLAGDLYVLCGLAVLAGTTLALARESLARENPTPQSPTPQSPTPQSPTPQSPRWRSWPSLIGWTMAWSPEFRLPSPAPPHESRRRP
jgi:alpha-1,2-mannosyltransferase